jgi:hypothetical protein
MSNDATQKEKRALAGSTAATTYFKQSQVAEELESTGRFTAKPSTVGSEPAVRYPRLPSSSPWSSDPVGLEPALGYSVHDMLPTGEVAEISASLNAIEALHLPSVAVAALPAAPTSDQSPDVVRPGSAANPLAEVLPKLVRRRIR